MSTHLIIPDSHAQPDVSNERFRWLSRFIMDRRPDVIVNIGDLLDMESLCSYDKGHKSFEGRRFSRDIAAGNEALDLLESEIKEYNDRQATFKKRQYKPTKVWLDGNHENRANRAEELQAELEGMLDIHGRLKLKKRGWDIHKFLEPVIIDGVVYQHYFSSGPMGMPIGGHYSARRVLQEIHRSGTFGHNHYFNYHVDTAGDGTRLHGLSVGCYFEHAVTYSPTKDQQKWWRGVVLKHNVNNGDYDLETVSLKTLKRLYS